jgi:hypothetical protein
VTGKLRANVEDIPYLSGRPRHSTDGPVFILEPCVGVLCEECGSRADYMLIIDTKHYPLVQAGTPGGYCTNHAKEAFWEVFTA